MPDKVAVIGAGSWGTAVAGLVSPHAAHIMLWTHSASDADGINGRHVNPRYLDGYKLPENVGATPLLAEAVDGSDIVILAVPSAHVREICSGLSKTMETSTPLLILSKGIELGTGLLLADVAADEVDGGERIAVLSGPNHAEEVCQGKMAAAVIAANDMAIAQELQELFLSKTFRAYVSDDIVGVEVCGAVKNVIAIACGAAVGMGAGDNTLALIMTRGLAEISRVVSARGGQPMTCMGLAGMGDLIATCTSVHSRNRSFGVELVKGVTVEQYQSRTHMVVEGALAAASVLGLAESLGVEVPITKAVHSMIYEGVSMEEAIGTLAERLPNEEFYGLAR